MLEKEEIQDGDSLGRSRRQRNATKRIMTYQESSSDVQSSSTNPEEELEVISPCNSILLKKL